MLFTNREVMKKVKKLVKKLTMQTLENFFFHPLVGGGGQGEGSLKKISVMHVIKLGFAPVSFPPG
jgi:hypothetical protein